MARKLAEPKIVLPEDVDPRHNWDRPITALGHMRVDFEERVNFRRLHDYRFARVRLALARSELGALLCFDQRNTRTYLKIDCFASLAMTDPLFVIARSGVCDEAISRT